MPGDMNAKDAKLVLKLTADSGYKATVEHRVSAYEWGDILARPVQTQGIKNLRLTFTDGVLTGATVIKETL